MFRTFRATNLLIGEVQCVLLNFFFFFFSKINLSTALCLSRNGSNSGSSADRTFIGIASSTGRSSSENFISALSTSSKHPFTSTESGQVAEISEVYGFKMFTFELTHCSFRGNRGIKTLCRIWITSFLWKAKAWIFKLAGHYKVLSIDKQQKQKEKKEICECFLLIYSTSYLKVIVKY